MKCCPFCGHANDPMAIQCRKCENYLVSSGGTLYCPARTFHFGPEKAHDIRNKALAALALGLLIKVYWGGYGPWPVLDDPTLSTFREWLEPFLFGGGALGYLAGFFLRWV